MKILACIFLALTLNELLTAQTEDRTWYNTYFDQAAIEFNIPADVLKGMAFAETRWSQLQWAEGDTASACNGMPRPYGVMSLWDNQYFGHSLIAAAKLIGESPAILKNNVRENIRGAAALLRKYFDESPLPEGTSSSDIESWRNAIAQYCGLPQTELAQQHALDVYTFMTEGYHAYGIEWNSRDVNLELVRASVKKIQENIQRQKKSPIPQAEYPKDQPDYPPAKWVSAYPGHWYTTGNGRNFVVVHDMEGYYLSTISYFQQSGTSASIHFCVNSGNQSNGRPAGEITQMVELQYWAWHVVCWNRWMLGIEHEGFVSNPAWYTQGMYESSAKLTGFLCNKFNIPKDRNHIIGHTEWQNQTWKTWMATNYPAIDVTCNTHTDPGPYWDWTKYMNLLQATDTITPSIASTFPGKNAAGVPAYKDVVIKFNVPMDVASTTNAFTITPDVPGTKTWDPEYKILRFHPTNFLAFSTTYTVTIDTSAKNISRIKSLDANNDGGKTPFTVTFTICVKDTSGPVVIRSYPKQGAQQIPQFGEIAITLNEPVQSSTIGGRISIQDSTGQNVGLGTVQVDSLNDQSLITFSPAMIPRGSFKITVLPGIKDLYGNSSVNDYTINFRVAPDIVVTGTVFDSFESNSRGWIQPSSSAGTMLVDTNLTLFTFSPEKKKSGTNSGKLTYTFTKAQNGVVVLDATGRPALDSYSAFGMWINGDESGNTIELIFQPGDQKYSVGIVDWRGWKFINVDLATITGPSKKFSDLIVRQISSAVQQGVIYLDDMQINASVTTGISIGTSLSVMNYSLEQNYPNPFNPSTKIRYSIPEQRFVTLQVFDVLGREVALLEHSQKAAGMYEVDLNASHLSSGVYLYRLMAGTFVSVRPMLLVK